MGNMATLPLAQLPKEDEEQFKKGFSPVAPLVYCALASLVYFRIWVRGFVVGMHMLEGSTLVDAIASDFPEKAYLPDAPPWGGTSWKVDDYCALWGGAIATEYMWECFLLILGPWRPGGWSIFPRWKRIHCMQHHLPFAAFVYTSIALQLYIPNTFGGKEGTVVIWLMTLLNGNEFLETLQTTLTHPRVLSLFGWKNSDVLQKPHTLAPLENTRLLYAFVGVTCVLIGESYAVAMCMYLKRAKILLKSGTMFRLSDSETTFVREHVGTHVGHRMDHRVGQKNKSK